MSTNAPFFVDNEVIILSQNGTWLADGTEITHEPTRRLFARSLKKDEKGYFLAIGHETKHIHVEDTAYFVQRIEGNQEEGYELLINDETREKLHPHTLKYRPGRLICRIKSNQEEARFLHAAYFDLLKSLQEDPSSYYLEFGLSQQKLRVQLASK